MRAPGTTPVSQLRRFLPLLIMIAIGAVIAFSGILQHLSPDRIAGQDGGWLSYIDAYPWQAGAIYVLVLAFVVATGMPGPLVIIIAGGMLFGTVKAAALSTLALVLGSLALFFIARHAFGSGKRPPPRFVDNIRQGYQANPASYTLFLRLVPMFPFGGVTMALAWLRCPLWLFTLATAIGGGIMATFEAAIGAGLARSISAGEPVSVNLFLHPHVWVPMLALAIIALSPIVVQKLRARSPAE